ncbi:MAG: class I mannose-6-phosphate isomerase [Verrucomicrobia bacterium]|nr:class I mannose-6-phosphate isomerase [Verrucomicrobiota bacterium]
MESCLTFAPVYMPRVWGGRALRTIFNRKLPVEKPIGESWELVDRADAQSVVNHGDLAGTTLHELWQERRSEVFGAGLAGERFPLLVKILDAATVLSVQVHPPAAVAQKLAGEPKCEIWYFVQASPGAAIYSGLKGGTTREGFERALADGSVVDCLHRLATRAGEFIFIPSGRLHAIDAGNVIFEIQQNSDTTYRVFDWNRLGLDGKPRRLHVDESLAAIDFDDHEPGLGQAEGEQLVHCRHFRVERWQLQTERRAHEPGHFAVFQVAQGVVRCGGRLFNAGDLFLVPAVSAATVAPVRGPVVLLRTVAG